MRITGTTRSANDDAAGEDRRMVLMIVIVAGASDRQGRRLTALPWCQEAHRVDLTTIRGGWIRSAGDIVGLHVIVDEGDTFAGRDDELARIRAGW